MKKKPVNDPVVAREIMELAKKSVGGDVRAVQRLCAVCQAPCSPSVFIHGSEDEDLCWICRRLKISAWRDSDQQMSAQE